VHKKIFAGILGCAWLLHGGAASAFTLITIPPASQEQASPSNTVTDSTTAQTQVQPIAGTIRAQMLGSLRPRGGQKTAEVGGMKLALNAPAGTASDVDYLAAAGDSSGAGSGSGGGNSSSAWISGATNSLENTFSRTAFYGATNNIQAGYDLTRSNKYILGLSLGQEASNYVTQFNSGDQRVRGYNVNPYFGVLLSDAWSLDLILGYGSFDTRQSRTTATLGGTVPVDSDFSSKRSFASTNLTNVSTWGSFKLTSSLGYLGSRNESDAYTESNGNAVESAKQTSKQWSLLEEAAYGRGASEGFFSARYEHNKDSNPLQFSSGEQPANDPSSVMLSLGMRYFGQGMSASVAFNRRVGEQQVQEYGFAMLLRFDL
jgi:hypothetical protein